ncbi:tripartite tricarboxylate transporter substrate binding protein [Variovorax sp. dw_308]|uniref:Bug family tripartite tricarboxylate transporter substrate binding protein n=1 Tax=Variovorax sp. dw_308 TaxID=2721546 RepID=UPI001C468CFF|nr:tripartite tricarboxylate transporter substrate binding protein [Variovorax sp. dw_308]
MKATVFQRSRRHLLALLGAQPLLALAQPAAWPTRPVRLIVPNAPASSVDTIGRIVANQLAQPLHQPVVVDNRAGAAGALGVEVGRMAAPDGYSLIVASSSSMSVAPLLQKAVTYDPLNDFDFVSLVAVLPNVLVCHPALAVRNTAELIAWAKSRDGKTNMASAGVGSVSHLAGIALQSAAGFESLHVPYKGGSQGVASVVSGETDWVLTPAPAALGLVQSGRLRLLGHSMGVEAHPLGPVPSIGETVRGFEFSSWIGLMAPKGLPPSVADTLRQALTVALQQPALRESFEANGAVPATDTGQEFRVRVERDIALNRKAIKVAGVQPE